MQEKACRLALPQCSGDNVGDLLEPEAVLPDPTSKSPAKMTEVALVLQGGGALGAYEYGGHHSAVDLMDQATIAGRDITLRAVTGVLDWRDQCGLHRRSGKSGGSMPTARCIME